MALAQSLDDSDNAVYDGKSDVASSALYDEKSQGAVDSPNGPNVFSFDGNRTSESDMITVEIDLTDPEDLAAKLDQIDLTDEETDLLLEKAQQLNIWLRRELLRQRSSGVQGPSDPDCQRQSATFLVSAPAAESTSDGDETGPGFRRARSFSGGSSTLPPLVERRGQMNASYAQSGRHPLPPSFSRQGPSPYECLQQSRPSLRSAPGSFTTSPAKSTVRRGHSGRHE